MRAPGCSSQVAGRSAGSSGAAAQRRRNWHRDPVPGRDSGDPQVRRRPRRALPCGRQLAGETLFKPEGTRSGRRHTGFPPAKHQLTPQRVEIGNRLDSPRGANAGSPNHARENAGLGDRQPSPGGFLGQRGATDGPRPGADRLPSDGAPALEGKSNPVGEKSTAVTAATARMVTAGSRRSSGARARAATSAPRGSRAAPAYLELPRVTG